MLDRVRFVQHCEVKLGMSDYEVGPLPFLKL